MSTWPKFYLNISSGSGIIIKVVLFYKNYRYKKFSPAETSKISEFRWLYWTSHKKISTKYLLVGFHRIFPIDLGFQPHQIQLYTNLFQVSQKFGSNHLGYFYFWCSLASRAFQEPNIPWYGQSFQWGSKFCVSKWKIGFSLFIFSEKYFG